MYPMHMEGIGWLVVMVLWIIPAWKVLGRLGMTSALALLAAIPFIGFLVLLFVVANSRWPNFAGSGKV
jgi:hypothetical protein